METAVPLQILGISRSADVCRWAGREAAACGAGARIAPGDKTSREPGRAAVRWVAAAELTAAVVPPLLQLAEPPENAAGPLEHAALLAAIFRQGDVLPIRFGVVLPHEEAVCDLLRRRRDDLLRDLDRLQGAGEMGLRIELPSRSLPPEPPPPGDERPPDTSPARYLAARRARYRRQDQQEAHAQHAAQRCVWAMRGLYRSWRRLSPEPPGTVRLAFLVERHLWKDFAGRLETARAHEIGPPCTLLGPWPPYSFL
jgi:hypothetical protein